MPAPAKPAATLLLVEDASICREPLARLLEIKGFRVLCAGDGVTALSIVQRQVPDLVLLDIAMPHMDGLSFLRELRRSPAGAHVPVIVLTAVAHESAMYAAGRLGVRDYVLKSLISYDTLEARIRQLITWYRGLKGGNGTVPPPPGQACLAMTPAACTPSGSPSSTPPQGTVPSAAVAPPPSAAGIERSPAAPPAPTGIPLLAGPSPSAAPAVAATTSNRPAEGTTARAATPSPETPRPAPADRDTMVARFDAFTQSKTLAGVVAELVATAGSPRSSLSDLVDLLKRDAVLATRVLQVANTPAYAAANKHRISTLDAAVRQIGSSKVASIAASVGIFEAMGGTGADGLDLIRCWQHSFAVASILSKMVTPDLGVAEGMAHLVGLCHDLDEIVLRQCFPAEYEQLLARAAASGRTPRELQSAVLGLDAQWVLNRLGTKLSLPEPVATPIREHARPPQPRKDGLVPAASVPLTKLLWIADNLANALLLSSSSLANIAPIPLRLVRELFGQETGTAKFVDGEQLRCEVFSNTCLLARLSSAEESALAQPLIRATTGTIWYARHAMLSELDPLELALRSTTGRLIVEPRLPSADESADLTGLVVAVPTFNAKSMGIPELRSVMTSRLPGGRPPLPPTLLLGSAEDASAQVEAVDQVTTAQYPLSLGTLSDLVKNLAGKPVAHNLPLAAAA